MCDGPVAQTVQVPRLADEAVRFEVLFEPQPGRVGGFSALCVRIDNGLPRARRVRVEYDGRVCEQAWSGVIEAGARTDVWMPVQLVSEYVDLEVSVEGVGRAGLYSFSPEVLDGRRGGGFSFATLGGRRVDEADVARLMRATFPAMSGELRENTLPVGNMPPSWWMLTGNDLIFVDGTDARVATAEQTLVEQYLRAGGRVVVLFAESLAPGPLRDAVAPLPLGRGSWHGFGRVLPLSAGDSDRFSDRGVALLGRLPDAASSLGEMAMADTARSSLFPLLEAPSLQAPPPPTGVFMLLIALFAIVVGPVNYLALRARGRLSHLMWTIPALGFGTTAVVLTVGLLRDGLDTRRSSGGVTFLDQRTGAAAHWSEQVLFSGFSPGSVRPHPESLVEFCDVLEYRSPLDFAIWRRAADGTLSGSVVPARQSVALGTCTVRTERSRLRFRREGDAIVVLPDANLRPVTGPRAVLLRDFEGEYWGDLGTDGRLEPEPAVSIAMGKLDPYGARDGRLEPGTYLARVEAPPWLEDLGIDAVSDPIGLSHFVLGRLAPEDLDD
jgi:hypothetical protein